MFRIRAKEKRRALASVYRLREPFQHRVGERVRRRRAAEVGGVRSRFERLRDGALDARCRIVVAE